MSTAARRTQGKGTAAVPTCRPPGDLCVPARQSAPVRLYRRSDCTRRSVVGRTCAVRRIGVYSFVEKASVRFGERRSEDQLEDALLAVFEIAVALPEDAPELPIAEQAREQPAGLLAALEVLLNNRGGYLLYDRLHPANQTVEQGHLVDHQVRKNALDGFPCAGQLLAPVQ